MNAIDSNVIVYAFDLDDQIKGPRAVDLLASLPHNETVVLWQVAFEVSAVLTRIGRRAPNVPDPRAAIQTLLKRFPLAMPREQNLDKAWDLKTRYQLSWWDAALIAGCIDAGVTTLYTEDLQSRPVIEGVKIVNPFA